MPAASVTTGTGRAGRSNLCGCGVADGHDTQHATEQRVLRVMDSRWQHKDGRRNMGNLAEKAGLTLGELHRTLNKLEREGRYFPHA